MKYYCFDQFKTLNIVPINNSVGVSPCCASKTKPVDVDVFDFKTNEYLDSIRQATLQDEPAKPCFGCWHNEKFGNPSRRTLSNYHLIEDIAVEVNRVDITCQNICNLACIQCGPHSSSAWAKEVDFKVPFENSFEHKIKLFSKLNHSKIQYLHFTGGEPLMTSEHLRILNIYKDNAELNQLTLSYNTNGTFFPDEEVLDIWRRVKRLAVVVSIDAVGPTAEVVRYGTNWEETNLVINKFKEFATANPNVNLSFLCCVSNFNLLELPSVIEYTKQFGKLNFQFNILAHYAPNVIPEYLVSVVEEKFKNYPELANILDRVKNRPSDLANQLTYFNSQFDTIQSRRNSIWRPFINS